MNGRGTIFYLKVCHDLTVLETISKKSALLVEWFFYKGLFLDSLKVNVRHLCFANTYEKLVSFLLWLGPLLVTTKEQLSVLLKGK